MLEALRSFFNWCALPTRKYIDRNPLEGITKFDGTPRVVRRALTNEEAQDIINRGPYHFQILAKTALCTGFRRNELRSLTEEDIDVGGCTLRMDADMDKARKERFQPIPRWLVDELKAYAQTGDAEKQYRQYYCTEEVKKTIPAKPLLFVPNHAARMVKRIAKEAGIAEVTKDGKLDFHALRTAFINFVIESGADIKTAQTLARHATASMTLNIYGRARADRMADTAVKVGQIFNQSPKGTPESLNS